MKKALSKIYNILPKGSMVTATYDSGKEFACYSEIENELEIDIYSLILTHLGKKDVMKTVTGYLEDTIPKGRI